jgi:hypothetical protein
MTWINMHAVYFCISLILLAEIMAIKPCMYGTCFRDYDTSGVLSLKHHHFCFDFEQYTKLDIPLLSTCMTWMISIKICCLLHVLFGGNHP